MIKFSKLFYIVVAITGTALLIQAETQYTWEGTVDTIFTNSANWTASPGVAPYNATNENTRINVYNSSGNPLYYTADQGHQVYINNTGRTIFIGNGLSSGSMHITGGTFENIPSLQNGISNNNDGELIINGGIYRQTSMNTTFLVKYAGPGTGTLTVSNGLFDAGYIKYGHANYEGSGIINLDV